MTSSELSRVVYVLVVFGLVVIQLAYEVDSAQRMVNSTNDNNDPHGRSGKVAMFPYRMLGIQRRERTTKAEGEPFALFVASSSSIDQEKRARSSFRGDLGKRMLVLTDALSPEDDLSTRVTWLPGKRIKVSSRFRGDLGKRARSSFRGDLGKREELREQNEEQDDLQQTPLIDDNIHQLSPFLLSDSRYTNVLITCLSCLSCLSVCMFVCTLCLSFYCICVFIKFCLPAIILFMYHDVCIKTFLTAPSS